MPVSMTFILIGVMSVATFIALNNRKFYDAWILNPYRMEKHKEYYRFLTSGLIHANFIHWFFNMFTFFFAANYIESYMGGFHLVAILFLGIILSDFPSFSKHRHDPGYRSLGASGGVAAVMFAFIMIEPISTISVFFIPMPAFVFGALFLLYSYYQGKGQSGDNVNHSAHFYGALVGMVYILILYPTTLFTFFEQLLSWRI
ncbi:MAG: rhomboid family protein [Chitinophagaceae bacterium]|nr:rhomboid family protein [Chitinophagaceae bacterium]